MAGASGAVGARTDGTGVAVTPCTKFVIVPPRAPATTLSPPAPTYRTRTATARTPAPRASRPMSGMPRLRRIGACTDRRLCDGARGRALTGVGRPPDGGRGRTWFGRVPRRVAIAGDCRMPPPVGPLRGRHGLSGCECRSGTVRCTLARSRVLNDAARPAAWEDACRPAIHAPDDRSPTQVPASLAGPARGPVVPRRVRPPQVVRHSASGRSRASRRRRWPLAPRARPRCRWACGLASASPTCDGTSARTSI